MAKKRKEISIEDFLRDNLQATLQRKLGKKSIERTGLGNVIRVEGKDADKMISDILTRMVSPIDFDYQDCGDYIFKKLDDRTIGVASKKLYELV